MLKFILRRLVIGIPVLLGITIIIFALMEAAPGDISDYLLPADVSVSPEAMEAIRARFGLDRTPVERYLHWLGELSRGNLGYRFLDGEMVITAIGRAIGPTLLLSGVALVVGITGGVALGIYSALHRYSRLDVATTAVSFLGVSLPAFISGIFVLYVLSIKLGWFPTGGMRPVNQEPTFWTYAHHMALPVLILSFYPFASFMRFTRFSMLDVIRMDYITTARGKGLSERRVTFRHLIPNALIPVISLIGLNIPTLVTGAVFTETVFSWPGMGTLYLSAVQGRDVPLIMGLNLVIAVVILLSGLLSDILYSIVDPRIRL